MAQLRPTSLDRCARVLELRNTLAMRRDGVLLPWDAHAAQFGASGLQQTDGVPVLGRLDERVFISYATPANVANCVANPANVSRIWFSFFMRIEIVLQACNTVP